MTIEERFRSAVRAKVDQIEPMPAAWESIKNNLSRRRHVSPGPRRIVIVAFALLLSAGSFTLLWSAFHDSSPPTRRVGASGRTFTLSTALSVSGVVQDVVAGDGIVWIATRPRSGACSGSIERVDAATDSVSGHVDVAIEPEAIAFDGSLWVAGGACPGTREDGALLRIDPQTLTVQGSIPLNGIATAVVVDGSGSPWVALETGPTSGVLVRVDPVAAAVDRTITLEARALEIEADGTDVWVLIPRGTGVAAPGVHRFDAATGKEQAVFAPGATGFVVGDSSVWVAEGVAGELQIVRFSERSGAPEGTPIGLGSAGVADPFAALGGDLWFIGGNGGATLKRVTVGGDVTEIASIADHNDVTAALDTSSGVIWIAENPTGVIFRVDPS